MRKNRKSLKVKLIQAFLITSIVPILLVNLFAHYNSSRIVRENAQELTRLNLQQTRSTLDIWLEGYEDILYQIYTDDDVVELVERINRGENVALCRNQLIRRLHALFYSKEYIKSISVLTSNGALVFYDLLTGSNTENSWLPFLDLSEEELYARISAHNDTTILSTRRANDFNAEDNYLFHLGHRIIDYRNVNLDVGVVIVSIDERLLNSVCNSGEKPPQSYRFMVDGEGRLMSHPERERLGAQAIEWTQDEEARREAYAAFAGKDVSAISLVHDPAFGCDIVDVSGQEAVMQGLQRQTEITLAVIAVSMTALTLMIVMLTRRLSSSLGDVADAMKRAGGGELTTHVQIDGATPGEVESIAQSFNEMIDRLDASRKSEQEASERQREAEIAALEARLNPHFLYNSLDTINWMAIDRDEFEISNSVNALARILRYGIDNSNGIVTVREEYEWLKNYLYFQQTRLKNTFRCDVQIAPEAMGARIHKLLLQPFVENSIMHGFDGTQRVHELRVAIERAADALKIEIYDNGKGIPAEVVAQMNRGAFPQSGERNHIGMENAVNRIHMYYGDRGSVRIESEQGAWTRIRIAVPALDGEGGEEL